ncbi:hypothetical protein JB92DRAFT_3230351 [Gautieria morchelliformis]|nr:hypothetical protein JB92DRAFT_3230351 [Gautieria morchelliformis]
MPIHLPPPATLSRLETCPVEVLEAIVLATVGRNLPGPPADLASLLCVSKAIYFSISMKNNTSLYGKIFVLKFDDRAPVRRLGETCKHGSIRTEELVKRFQSLKMFKMMKCRQFCAAPTARGDLWVAYLLFLEHDRQNYQQLVSYAAVDKFASSFIKMEDPSTMGLRAMYASTHAPITSFDIPLTGPTTPLLPPTTSALPLAALPSSRRSYLQDYFGVTLPVTHPVLAPAVFLSCAVRLEAAGAEMARRLPEGHGTPTTMFADWGQGCGSEQYDHDWSCLLTCYIPWMPVISVIIPRVFTPGMLTGTWVGRCFEVPEEQFDDLLAPQPSEDDPMPPEPDVYPTLMQFLLREYHAHDHSQTLGFNDSSQDLGSNGVFKAWLPQGVGMSETERELCFSVDNPGTMRLCKYDIYDPATAARRALDEEFRPTAPFSDGVYDIVLTAQTGDHFGSVWGHKSYYGRVRGWDGLILLFSVATPGEPSLIFSGYIHGSTNLVGRWHETATPVDLPGWEGVWSMIKIE